MKIEKAKRWRISSVNTGDVFIYNDEYYIKTDFEPCDSDTVVCVRLSDGHAKDLLLGNFCIIVDSKVVIG